MPTLEKRIDALEQATVSKTDTVMFIHFVGLGETDKEIQSLTRHDERWERLPGETEQELKERATKEAKPNPNPIGALVFFGYS